jgi:hypothetical protein
MASRTVQDGHLEAVTRSGIFINLMFYEYPVYFVRVEAKDGRRSSTIRAFLKRPRGCN